MAGIILRGKQVSDRERAAFVKKMAAQMRTKAVRKMAEAKKRTGKKKLATALDIPGTIISDEVNKPGANYYARELKKGTCLRIIDLGGQQAVDFLCFDLADRQVRYNAAAGVTIVAILGELLRVLGLFDYNILFHNPLMSRLGIIDNALQVVITINAIYLVLFGAPVAIFLHDLTRTLHRLRLLTSHGTTPDLDSEESYLKGAQEVFQRDDQVAVFVFGHTHAAFLKRQGPAGQVVLNTGTWLKLLRRVPVRLGYLPAVYYPSYRLNYFRIEEENDHVVINYVAIPKTPERELTWLQRLVTLGKTPKQQEAIPAKTVLDF